MVTVVVDNKDPFLFSLDLESPLNPFEISKALLNDPEGDIEFKGRGHGGQGVVHIMKARHLKAQPSNLFPLMENVEYIDQDGDFLTGFKDPAPPDFIPRPKIEGKDDHFWVFDASISYRLPKRYGLITIEAKNLFDKSFNFQDTDPGNPQFQPERLVFAKLTLAF